MEGDNVSTNSPAAPFNAAIDCLMRISKLIQDIKRVSVEFSMHTGIAGINLTSGQAQHIKRRLVKQLYVQAIPLLSDTSRETIKKMIDGVRPIVFQPVGRTGKKANDIEIYDIGIDEKLDDIVIEIEKDLQDHGKFFMPPRLDPRRAILRGH